MQFLFLSKLTDLLHSVQRPWAPSTVVRILHPPPDTQVIFLTQPLSGLSLMTFTEKRRAAWRIRCRLVLGSTILWLCGLGQATLPLWAPVSSCLLNVDVYTYGVVRNRMPYIRILLHRKWWITFFKIIIYYLNSIHISERASQTIPISSSVSSLGFLFINLDLHLHANLWV